MATDRHTDGPRPPEHPLEGAAAPGGTWYWDGSAWRRRGAAEDLPASRREPPTPPAVVSGAPQTGAAEAAPRSTGLQPLYDQPSPVPAAPRRRDALHPVPQAPPRRRGFWFFRRREPEAGLPPERERELQALCRVHLPTVRRIAVVSRKGGIGKTTTALLLGHQLASLRGDHVVAVDANPDAGSLGDRVPRETHGTVTDVLRQAAGLRTYTDVRALTSRAPSGLEVVASDNDPRITEALGRADLQQVMAVLARNYAIVIADTGTGVLDPATRGVLAATDQVVVCAAPSIDSSRVTALTLDWLEQNGHRPLVENAVVAINGVQEGIGDVDLLQHYFERRVRAVVRVPFDRQLAQGGETRLEDLAPATRTAYLILAGMVAAGFSW